MGNRFVIWSDSVICSYAMQGIEEEAMRRNGINAITKVISGVTDDMLSAMNSMGIIRRRECAKKEMYPYATWMRYFFEGKMR